MKYFLYLLMILPLMSINAQDVVRIRVHGKLVVEHDDISGVTVYNVSSGKGTITDDKGEFDIAVALNDDIQISAIQFERLNFKVNAAIIASRTMKVFLLEEMNKLDAVIVNTRNLSGNLKADIQSRKPFSLQQDALYFGAKTLDVNKLEPDYKTEVVNRTMSEQRNRFYNGLNLVNVVDQLLLPVFRSEARRKKKADMPKVPAKAIKYYFASEFLTTNFNIPEDRVQDFIAFVESEDFDFTLLNYGRELEFLELLHEKSVVYLKNEKL